MKEIRKDLRLYGHLMKLMPEMNDPEKIRKMDLMAQKAMRGKWIGLLTVMTEEYIPRRDGSFMRVCIVRSKHEKAGEKTGVLWIHGGGYATGMPEQCFGFADRFLKDGSAVMILPDYRKSHEEPYPAALEDCYTALSWMRARAHQLQIREDQLFVGGESAGGGLTCALTQLARDIGEISISFQMPLYPMIDDRDTETNVNNSAPVWNTEKNRAAWRMYKGTDEDVHPYCAPARQTDYTDLPPAFTVVGTAEPFLAETRTYFRHLYEADVPVMIREVPGAFHAFDMLCYGTRTAAKIRKLEERVFRYAQANFTKEQPEFTETKKEDDLEISPERLDELIERLDLK